MQKGFLSGVLTISDKGSVGLREDESGKIAVDLLKTGGFQVAKKGIVPDDKKKISDLIIQWIDQDGLSLVVTSGGTGLSPSDVTPQAMEEILDYQIPGIPEAMRAASLLKTPHAMISRAMAGVRGTSLIINLPGSPGGVRDNLSVVLPALEHALMKLNGDPSDCAAIHEKLA
jgi:molybdopterin adenylyltransferase